jgi:hypothetical protein
VKVFTKPFEGVKSGEFYPTAFNVGDDCPDELLEAAVLLKVVEEKPKKKGKGE